jgi:hypothetical protein
MVPAFIADLAELTAAFRIGCKLLSGSFIAEADCVKTRATIVLRACIEKPMSIFDNWPLAHFPRLNFFSIEHFLPHGAGQI